MKFLATPLVMSIRVYHFICLSTRITPKQHEAELYLMFCMLPCLWLGPSPAALRPVMYFRFCAWMTLNVLSHSGPLSLIHI